MLSIIKYSFHKKEELIRKKGKRKKRKKKKRSLLPKEVPRFSVHVVPVPYRFSPRWRRFPFSYSSHPPPFTHCKLGLSG
jgi:hypothetical protein